MKSKFDYMSISERTLPLQGFRVLLMLGIVCLHVYQYPVFGSGRELVSFFFVISGFLYRDKLPWNAYLLKKAISVFPVYWIVLFLSEVICYLRGGNNLTWDIIPHVLLLQSWVPDLWFSFAYVGVAWFVSSLMFCYVVSHLVYRYVSRVSTRNCLLGILILSFFVCYTDECRVDFYNQRYAFVEWFTYVNPVFCMLEYMMGMLLWNVVKNAQYVHLKVKHEPLALILLAIYFYCIYENGGAKLSMAHVCMIGLVYKFGSRIFNGLFANKYIVWLSSYVMFVYMSHQSLTINCFRSRIESNVVLVVLCFLLGILFGMFYNRFVSPKMKRLCGKNRKDSICKLGKIADRIVEIL